MLLFNYLGNSLPKLIARLIAAAIVGFVYSAYFLEIFRFGPILQRYSQEEPWVAGASFITGPMLFLSSNQQCQSIEGSHYVIIVIIIPYVWFSNIREK